MTGRGKKSSKKKKFASGVSQHNLLAFGRAEGLPSDDSEDSDYQPSDGEQPSKRKRGMVLQDLNESNWYISLMLVLGARCPYSCCLK
jgi:hypothetical protein